MTNATKYRKYTNDRFEQNTIGSLNKPPFRSWAGYLTTEYLKEVIHTFYPEVGIRLVDDAVPVGQKK